MSSNQFSDEQFKQVSDSDRVFFPALLTGDVSGSIEGQEKQGQRSVVGGQRLPKIIFRYQKVTWEAICAAWGLTIVGEVDDLFNNVELPPGWQIVASSHSMWTALNDAQGRQRALIFYKAAFYDRGAHIVLESRYICRTDYDSEAPLRLTEVVDNATKQTIHILGTSTEEQREERNQQEEAARKWLDEHYPNHLDPLAYWEG